MTGAKTVNPYYLLKMLGHLAGMGDCDHGVEKYRGFQPNDEARVRDAIRIEVVPVIQAYTDESIETIKLTLRYYLSSADVPWEDIFCSVLPPIDPPDNARDYFVWAWEECFPGESWTLSDLPKYSVVSSVNEANRSLHHKPKA